MLQIPEVSRVDLAFGNIDHMPKYHELPERFQDWFYEPHCRAVSSWFMKGTENHPNGIRLDGKAYVAKDGVDAGKALAAIRSILTSWAPKHEHKIAACGYLFSEWFKHAEPEADVLSQPGSVA